MNSLSIIIADIICAKLKNLMEEKELPQSSLAKVRKLKEFDEQRPKPSRRKGTGNCTKSHDLHNNILYLHIYIYIH